jgi:hypothetical protein
MDSDRILKILLMIKEGVLTPEQALRLIQELNLQSTDEAKQKTDSKAEADFDILKAFSEAGKVIGTGLESVATMAQNAFKETLGILPQAITLKILDLEGEKERFQVSMPLKIFLAMKPLFLTTPPIIVHPLQKIDLNPIFKSLESGETGKIFEYLDHSLNVRVEIWVQ